MICDYGCEQEAKYQLKNGKWCCNVHQGSCVEIKRKNRESHLGKFHTEETKQKISKNGVGMSGKTHSEEAKQKMSDAKKGKHIGENNHRYGKKHSEETRQKLSESHKGKHHPEEQKQKISNSMYGKNLGKFHTIETKHKISINRMGKCIGENNPSWKGGISCYPYCEVWKDKEYKDWIAYERDGKCFGPECNGKHIHKLMPHHINYNKEDCGPMNLIALCCSCNGKANKDRDWHQAWYTEIMRRRTA